VLRTIQVNTRALSTTMQQPLSRSNSPTDHKLLLDREDAVTLKQQNAQHRSVELDRGYQHLWQECLDDCAGNEGQATQQYDRIINALTRHMQHQEQQQQQQAGSVRQASKYADDISDASRYRSVTRQQKRQKVAAIVEAKLDDDSKVPFDDDAASGLRLPNGISSPDELSHSCVSESSDHSDGLYKNVSARCKLKWCKPGIVSKLVGVSHSVLRSWAKAKLVTTMVSSGGHRLYHLQSVRRYIAAALPATAAATQPIKTPVDEPQSAADADQHLLTKYQLLVYMRLSGASDDKVRLKTMSESIKTQVLQRYQFMRMEDHPDASLFILELDAMADAEPGQPQSGAVHGKRSSMNTVGMRRMLRTICKPDQASGLKVVLRSSDDISPVPAAYAFFQLLCRCMGATIDIVPELQHQL
jgi:hypothetical protein